MAAGQIGQQPVPPGQKFQLTINTLGRLIDPEQFARHHRQGGRPGHGGSAKRTPDASASIVRLRDVARIELGSQQYDQSCTLDSKPSVALSIYQLPGSNAMQTAKGVYAKMEELKARFPDGLEYKIVYDTTPFITNRSSRCSRRSATPSSWWRSWCWSSCRTGGRRSIPLIAVPVAIVGTFAVMAAMGF